MSWIRITPVQNIPAREGRAVKIGDREIAIFNLGDRFAAIENRCPHSGGPLCDGIISGTTVVCPLHGWRICLDTGIVKKPDVPVQVTTFATQVQDGVVLVDIPTAQEHEAAA